MPKPPYRADTANTRPGHPSSMLKSVMMEMPGSMALLVKPAWGANKIRNVK